MNPFLLRSLIPFFACLLCASLRASELSEAERAAAGLPVSATIEIEAGEGVTWSEVEAPGAEGGTALEVMVPEGASFRLRWANVATPSVVTVRFSLETATEESFSWETTYFSDAFAEDPNADGWTTATARVASFSWEGVSLILPAGWGGDGTGPARRLRLDGISAAPGFEVTAQASDGLRVNRYPEQVTYEPGQGLVLSAEPTRADVELWGWSGLPPLVEGPEPSLAVDSHMSVKALGGARYAFPGGEVVVPLEGGTHARLSESDEPLRLEVDFSDARDGRLRFRTEEAGYIEVSSRTRNPGASARFGWKGHADESTVSQRFWVAEGAVTFEVGVEGQFELSGFRFEPATSVALEVVGEGRVEGLASEGIYGRGETIELRAVPEEGWHFEGWRGAVESASAELSLPAQAPTELMAVFYREVAHRGLTLRVYGDWPWTFSEAGIEGRFTPTPTASAAIGVVLEGPGRLSFDAESPGHGYWLEASAAGRVVQLSRVGMEAESVLLPAGRQLALFQPELRLGGPFLIDLRIDGLNWEPGVSLSVEATHGGSIEGVDTESGLVPYGEPLAIRAIPDEGFRFVQWEGVSSSTEERIELSLEHPASLRAVFEKPVEGSFWARGLRGEKLWESLGDERWRSPERLERGQSARIEGVVTGPVHVKLEIEGPSGLEYEIDGGERRQAWNGSFIEIPEGEHRLSLIDEPDYGREQAITVRLGRYYPVDISVERGSLETTPSLNYDYAEQRYFGRIAAGETLAFEAVAEVGWTFLGWEGDLSGQEASGSVVMDGPVSAAGAFGVEVLEAGGLVWTTEPANNAYPEFERHLYPLGETTFFTTVEGPGTVSFAVFDKIACTEVRLNGELVAPAWTGREEAGWRIPLESGAQELSIYRPEGDPSGTGCGYASVRYISYVTGYGVALGAWGGRVTREPAQSGYEIGAEVSVSATASPGNQFVGWEGDFAGEPESFVHTVTGHANGRARYAAEETIGGLTWEYATPAPVYDSLQSVFAFLATAQNQSALSARTRVDGPAWVSCPVPPPVWGPFMAQLHVDGEAVEPGDYEYDFVVGEGEHWLEWRVASYADATIDPAREYTVPASLPAVRKTASISVTADAAAVTISPEGEAFAIGEAIAVTAPSMDEEGRYFVGWYDLDRFGWISVAATYRFSAREDRRLEARYAAFPLQVDGALAQFDSLNGQWEEEDGVVSPDGGSVLRFTDQSSVSVRALEAVTLSFAFQNVGEGAFFGLDEYGVGRVYSALGPQGWRKLVVRLEAGEMVTLRIEAMRDGESVRLGDFASSATWSPTILPEGAGGLVFTPGLEEASDGEAILVGPSEESAGRFRGWYREGKLVSDGAVELAFGERAALRPVFAEAEASALGLSFPVAEGTWSFGLDEEHGGYRLEAQRYLQDASAPNQFIARLDGPKVVSWKRDRWESEPRIELDGVAAPEIELLPLSDWMAFQVPPGEHQVVFTARTKEDRIEGLRATPGYVLTPREWAGGSVAFSPVRPAYEKGETVVATAIPEEGFRFAGWQSPYEGGGQSLSFVFGSGRLPTARFEPRVDTVRILGIDWSIENATPRMRLNGEALAEGGYRFAPILDLKRQNPDQPARMWADVTGPKVIRIFPDYSTSTGAWRLLTIDGAAPARWERRGDLSLIAIPDGTHRLEFSSGNSDWLDLDASYVQILEGYLVEARGVGARTRVDPLLDSYPAGTPITITVEGAPSAAPIEWSGLPGGSVTHAQRVQLAVPSGLDVEAVYWRPTRLFGMAAEYASETAWESVGKGGYAQAIGRLGAKSYLRFPLDSGGVFAYGMAVSDGGADVEISWGSTGSKVYRNIEYMNLEGAIRMSDGGGFVRIGFEETRGTWVGLESRFVLRDVGFSPLEPELPYWSWWNRYDPTGGASTGWSELSADTDGDGLTTYAEYLLDRNPFEPDAVMRIALRAPGDRAVLLGLLEGDYSGFLSSNIEYAFSPFGPWLPTSNLLEDLENASADGYRWSKAAVDWRATDSVYFRFDYRLNVPPLDSLIEE